jgi:glyoxylase-like metal-dependent hydrolase (beta-lactamase superfamily II)
MNNLLLVRPNSVLLVDTLPPGTYSPFIAAIHERTSGKRVNTLVNTHLHFDHAGLNADFKQTEGTETIIAHWRASEYLTGLQCIEDISLCMQALPAAAQPTQGVHRRMTLQPEDEIITLKAVEDAHSGADLVVYFERANVVCTGDVYFGGQYPIIDRTHGGTVHGMLRALYRIIARIDEHTLVVPSHGVLGNRQSLLEFADMLKTCLKRVRALMAQGLSEEQVMVDASFADLDARWGSVFISGPLFRRIVYRDLAADRGKEREQPTTLCDCVR